MFIGKFNKSVLVTYLGVAFAIAGMYFAFNNEPKQVMVCLALAGICDLFDGKIARAMKRDKDEISFGIQLDSIADIVNFVVFPVVYAFTLGMNEWYHVLGYVLFVVAGIQRLSHFNVMVLKKNDDSPVAHYTGLPVTSTSIILPLYWFLAQIFKMPQNLFNIWYIVLLYLIAFLYVSKIKVPKIKGRLYYLVAILALIGIIAVFLI